LENVLKLIFVIRTLQIMMTEYAHVASS